MLASTMHQAFNELIGDALTLPALADANKERITE